MKIRMIADHRGDGSFPTFKKGTEVALRGEHSHFLHWFECEIDGYKTYAPACYLDDAADDAADDVADADAARRRAVLARDYNPTELAAKAGDALFAREIVYAWLLAENDSGETGWIPAESVVSDVIETGLTDEEKEIIARGREEYKQGGFIPLNVI